MTSRRQFFLTSAAALAAPFILPRRLFAAQSDWDAWDAQVVPFDYEPTTSNPWNLHPRLLPRLVEASGHLIPGDIHVDARACYLYHIRETGIAMRYGVAIGRDDLYEPGVFRIGRKAKWPSWTPTANMLRHTPEYEEFRDGVPGGPENPLGARALYLFEGSRDTYLRIHGTPQPWSIGHRASSGCVRLVMAHIIDLYEQVETGSMAHLYPAE